MSSYAQGDVMRSNQLLDDLVQSYGDRIAYYLAQIMAFRMEPSEAFEWLYKARSADDRALASIINEPLFSNLHSDPSWSPFLESIGKSPKQLAAIHFEVKLPD